MLLTVNVCERLRLKPTSADAAFSNFISASTRGAGFFNRFLMVRERRFAVGLVASARFTAAC